MTWMMPSLAVVASLAVAVAIFAAARAACIAAGAVLHLSEAISTLTELLASENKREQDESDWWRRGDSRRE